MRTLRITLIAGSFLTFLLGAAVGEEAPPINLDHHGAVALSQSSEGKWNYTSFPDLLPLYVFEGDLPGKSMCDTVCTAAWPVLRADDDAKPIGNWTIIIRNDGRKQWAYKHQPVYTFYADTPANPKGVGLEENFYYEDLPDSTRDLEKKVATSGFRKKLTWQLLEP